MCEEWVRPQEHQDGSLRAAMNTLVIVHLWLLYLWDVNSEKKNFSLLLLKTFEVWSEYISNVWYKFNFLYVKSKGFYNNTVYKILIIEYILLYRDPI